jgi:dolichol-phosphate mannosyltransferase
MKVVVILPTYNERENITSLLDSIFFEFKKITNTSLSVLVVDDNSPDGTGNLIVTYAKTHPNIFLLTGQKLGLGKALLRGMSYAVDVLKADVIVQMDADLSHDPGVLPEFIASINNGDDFVVGSRYIPGGSIPANWGLHRKIYSVIGNAFVRFGLGYSSIHDWTGGFRAYRSAYVQLARHHMHKFSGYVFQIAFLYQAVQNGAHVSEVPIQFTDRRYGRSKIVPSQYIRDILLYVSSSRIQRIFQHQFAKFCIVGGIGFIINTFVLEVLVRVGWHPTFASVVGAEFAIISNFFLNNHWTFQARKVHGTKLYSKFFQFNTTSLGAIVIQAGTIAVGTHIFGVTEYRIFYLVGVGFGLLWNYVMYSRIIWKKHDHHAE